MLTAEENKVLLTKMRAVLKNAPPNALINEFLGLIDSNQHQTALLWGCKACRPGETALLSMLAILLWHMEHIELNLDKKDEDSISAIQHCVTNQNFDLLKLLIGWGASTVEVNADHKQDLYSRITTPTITKIKSSLNPHFHKLSKHLEATFLSSSLPDKNDIDTDRENEIYDSNRLIFINRTINFIHSHLKEDAPSAIITFEPNDIEAMELRNFKRSLLKLSLFRIAKTIANLSGSLRSYYGKCFHPVPFTWTTLEQLCFFELLYAGTVNSVIVVPTQEWFRDPESHAIGANFLKKGWDILYLTERFIPHILNDLTILEHLFNTMLHQIGRNERTPIEPIELPNIKAAISYIDNNRSLAQLLKLTTFQNQVVTPEGSNVVRNDLSSMPVCKIIKPEIATTMQRHALLRTLQYIGDFNGKKLSSDFYKLDPSIDWRALITIRDGIAHQDERDNKHKIQLLLKDEARLKGIIDEVLKIHQRIAHLIIKQEKKIGYYYGDAEEYCERVIRLEQQKNDLNKANDHHSAPPPLKPRITPEEQQQFIQALINANQDEHNPQRLKKEDLNKLLDECTLLFTSGKELSKAVFGAVLKPISYLRKMGEEKKRDYDSLKSILEVANTPPKIGSKAIQLQQQNEAAQREKEREALFDGLVLIRDLSKQLELNPEEQFLLNPLKRVEAALEATDNMFLFLADCGYFHSGRTDLKTVEQWDAFNTQVGRPTLINLLKGNGVLNDAMEYNFGQLLQHLDRIKAYKIIPRCKLMSSNYEQLRTLRNYVEHGSPFYDFARFVTSGNKAVVTRYHIICKGLNYVVELHEYLSNLKDALTFEQSKEKKASASSSASSAPLSRWPSIFNTLSGGAYNYFNLFKNVLAYDQSKEKKESSSSSVATSSQSGRWPGIFNSVSEGARECYPLPEIESDDDEKVTKPLPREDDRAASSHRHE